jgi:glycosyltransferase involved in cell wall biosynthesis
MRRRLFLTADGVGGVWQYAAELARALQPRGYDVIIATLGPAPTDAQRGTLGPHTTLIDTGLPLDWTMPDAATLLAAGATIAALAQRHRADIVQLNQPVLAAGAPFAMPIVAAAHSCFGTWWAAMYGDAPAPAEFAWQTDLMQRGLDRADAVVAPSRAFASALQRRYLLPALPHVVHNGRAPFARASSIQPSDAPGDFVFTAGRLWDDAKNVATLDRAAARLSAPFKAAGAIANAKGQVAVLHHLDVIGQVEEDAIADILAARPVFASAALYEPFGLAVLEAALAGCPLVLADIPTFREIWDGAAVFVPPRDDAAFAAAIEGLLADPSARLARGDLARRRAAQFTPARMAAGMDTLFASLLAGDGQVAA